jgi:putative inorganic carbon (HCO3(-)) transporter
VYASPNNLSLLLGRVTALALSVAWAGRRPRRLIYGLALIPLLLSLFLTYSRGGWLLSLPAALLAIGLLRGKRATLLALGAMALCLVVLLPLVGTERILSLLDVEQGTTFHRLKLWEAAVAMIRDHPLTGVGLDNFLYRYPEYMLREAWQEPGLSHPHNLILDYWTRLGIGGVIIAAWLYAAFFKVALRLYRRLPDGNVRAIILGLVASMAAALAHGMIDNSYFLVDLAFICFLSLGLVQSMERSLPESDHPQLSRR